MTKKKPVEKLSPIPKPAKRKQPAAPRANDTAAEASAPDLSGIAAGLHALAVPIDTVFFDPANARLHDEKNIDGIRGSLAAYKQCKPIVVRRADNIVIAGNGTLSAALSLGFSHIAAVFVDHLSDAASIGYAVADNRTSDLSEFDKEALDKLLREVDTGNDARLDAMLSELAAEMKIVPADTLPEPGTGGDDFDVAAAAEGECRVRSGDLWLIDGGKHKLVCGDSTDAATVERLFAGEAGKAVLMNTDPPYGCNLDTRDRMKAAEAADGRRRPSLDRDDDDATVQHDDLEGPKLQDFLERCIRTAVPHLEDNTAFYLWHPMLTQGTFFAAAAADILIHRQIIWVKPALLFGFGDYHWQHELCFYGWRRGNRPEFYGERNQTTIWDLRHDTPPADRVHPTQKPIELFDRPIKNHMKAGQICYEPFAGSGSQYIAAHRNSVRCFGVELSPQFCECVLRRCETEGMSVEKCEEPAAAA